MTVYTCRLCERSFHEQLSVLDIFSEEGKNLEAASKILSTLSIMVSENDPTSNFVCKVCFEHVESQARFISKCRATNHKIMNNAMISNREYRDEMRKILKLPIQSFYYVQQSNVNGIYNALLKFMKNREVSKFKPGSELDQLIVRCSNNQNKSVVNGVVNNENNHVINKNKTSQSSSVIYIDMNSINSKLKSVINNRIQSKTNDFIKKNGLQIKNNTVIHNGHETNINKSSIINTKKEYDYENIHNKVKSNSNGTEVADDIICLDDDDDDDVQLIEENVEPLKKLITVNNVNVLNTINGKKNQEKNKTFKTVFKFKRKLIPLFDQNIPFRNSNVDASENITNSSKSILSSNDTTEEMMVTPDMPLLPNSSPISSRTNDKLYYIVPPPLAPIETNSSLVTPETGFHFLFTSEQTVDLTSFDKLEEKKQQHSKRKTKKVNSKNCPPAKKNCKQIPIVPRNILNIPKEQIPSTSTTDSNIIIDKSTNSVSKSRPKRATALAVTTGKDKKGLWKLGKQSNLSCWTVNVSELDKSLLECPICNKVFSSPLSRRSHEDKEHSFSKDFLKSSVTCVPTLEDTTSTEQQDFLVYLNLVKRMSTETNVMNKLASRTQLVKALKMFGNIVGSYDCHFCKYTTSHMFILWAHMSSIHNEPESDKKSGLFCFICDRMLNKRTQLLKHLDKCIDTHLKEEISKSQQEVKKLSCEFCDEDITSLSHLEKHIWNHVNSQNDSS